MSDILPFKKREPEKPAQWVYECAGCGGQEFSLQLGGTVVCSGCAAPHTKLIWGQHFQSETRPERNDG